MEVHVNLKIFAFAILFYFTKQMESYAIFMIFALVHELGHLLCGITLGLKPKSLRIMPLGVSIKFKVTPKEYNKKIGKGNELAVKKFFIAFAGPLTNFLIVGIGSIIGMKFQEPIVVTIIYANLLIGLFNLIPIYPLDGGRCLKSILCLVQGRKLAQKKVNQIANFTVALVTAISSFLIFYTHNIAILCIIMYLWMLVIRENKFFETKQKVEKILEKQTKLKSYPFAKKEEKIFGNAIEITDHS